MELLRYLPIRRSINRRTTSPKNHQHSPNPPNPSCHSPQHSLSPPQKQNQRFHSHTQRTPTNNQHNNPFSPNPHTPRTLRIHITALPPHKPLILLSPHLCRPSSLLIHTILITSIPIIRARPAYRSGTRCFVQMLRSPRGG